MSQFQTTPVDVTTLPEYKTFCAYIDRCINARGASFYLFEFCHELTLTSEKGMPWFDNDELCEPGSKIVETGRTAETSWEFSAIKIADLEPTEAEMEALYVLGIEFSINSGTAKGLRAPKLKGSDDDIRLFHQYIGKLNEVHETKTVPAVNSGRTNFASIKIYPERILNHECMTCTYPGEFSLPVPPEIEVCVQEITKCFAPNLADLLPTDEEKQAMIRLGISGKSNDKMLWQGNDLDSDLYMDVL
jgi:hypothetical protein